MNNLGNFSESLYDLPITRVFCLDNVPGIPFVNILGEVTPLPVPYPSAASFSGSLVGLMVGLAAQSNIALNPTMEYLMFMLFDWYTDDEYTQPGKQIFNELITEVPHLYYEQLYEMSMQLIKTTTATQLSARMDLAREVNIAKNQILEIVQALCGYRELIHIEYSLADPVYESGGPFYSCSLFSRITLNNQLEVIEPGQWQMKNWNICDPWRFEEFIKNHVVFYDDRVSIQDIQLEHNLPYYDFVTDNIIYVYDSGGLKDIMFDLESRVNRSVDNIIVMYNNIKKPLDKFHSIMDQKKYIKDNIDNYDNKKILIKGKNAIKMYYKSLSFFILQPIITHKLLCEYLMNVDPGVDLDALFLFPSILQNKEDFIKIADWYKNTYNYGLFIKSSMTTIYRRIYDGEL